jgi:SAM-dependent methyltransferase
MAGSTGATPTQNATEASQSAVAKVESRNNFRFYDNRQKYLLFVNTCSEKWVVAQRVGMELANIHPRPPAVRVFDAGVGDGMVLARVMRAMHQRYPTMPFFIVGKEVSLEDVRLALDRMPDRFFEHPSTVLVMTNLYYSEAPWLTPKSVTAATSLVWKEVALTGTTSSEFEQQITELQPFLNENWRATVSKASGNPGYAKPVVLVFYREDHKFLLNQVVPRRGVARADFDLVIASQPYRARASVEFKAAKVLAPLARSLAPGGRLIAIQSHGRDPGLEIVQRIWPGENPFQTDRHQLLKATRAELGADGRDLNFNAYADNRSLFRYEMHTLPEEISEAIGTSTLLAAWNAAVYVAQIEDQRLDEIMGDRGYLEATQEVLRRHGGLWFLDESYVVSRKRD